METPSKISHQVLILWITSFFWYITQGFVWPFLGLYIYQASQGDIVLTALITAVPSFITILSVSFWGWAVDKLRNNRIFVLLGLFSAAFLYFLGILVNDAFLFFVTFSALSFFMNAFIPASQSYASLQSKMLDRSFGNLWAFASLGWFFGAIISGVFYDFVGMVIIFQFALILLMLAGILSIFGFKREKISNTIESEQITISNWRTVLTNPIIVTICLIGVLHYLFLNIAGAYFSVYITEELGGTSILVGTSVAIGTLLGTFLLPFFGRLSENYGRKPFILFTVGGLGLAGIICYLMPHPIVVAVLWGSLPFYTGLITGGYAMVADASQENDRGKTMGLFNAVAYLGTGIGPIIGAWIILALDMRTSYLISGIFELGLFLVIIFFVKETKRTERVNN
ncbi:MAG: MFS transporter [Candidatus Hermodarchaeota archaeon]